MKKRILTSAALVITLATLTGCGSDTKTLSCTRESADNGLTNEDKVVYEFEDNKVTSATQTASITVEGEYEQYKSDYKNSAQQAVDGYNKLDGISAKVEESNNKITVIVEMNPDKMSESDYTLYNMGESYESMNDMLINKGYTCK